MRAFWLLPLLLAAVPAAEPAAAEEPVRTEPGHMNSLPQFYIAPQPGLPRTRYRRAQVVYRLPKPLPELAVRDNALSRLCQRGAFIQEMNGFYWARTPERTYGVAFSGGANLVDPQNRRAIEGFGGAAPSLSLHRRRRGRVPGGREGVCDPYRARNAAMSPPALPMLNSPSRWPIGPVIASV